MRKISRAFDFLSRGDIAIVIVTRDLEFKFDGSGNGSSGNWRINPSRLRKGDKVIIYNRPQGNVVADIYEATFSEFSKSTRSDEPTRRTVNFTGCNRAGASNENWHHFADTGTSPIRYLSK